LLNKFELQTFHDNCLRPYDYLHTTNLTARAAIDIKRGLVAALVHRGKDFIQNFQILAVP